MTLKKAYITITITIIMMILFIILYALDVTNMRLTWAYSGFALTSIIAIAATIFSIQQVKHEQEVKKTGFFHTHKYELLDWVTFICFSIMTIFTVYAFFILPSDVSQNSMVPTLSPDDRILVYHFNYEPKVNDIVVIHITKEAYPLVREESFDGKSSVYYVKRIHGLPGDVISFEFTEGSFRILINNEIVFTPQGEQVLLTPTQRNIVENSLDDFKVKKDEYLVFGDNQGVSEDSRSIGTIKAKDIIGKAFYRLWPLGGLR
jgi:signal peptidase I